MVLGEGLLMPFIKGCVSWNKGKHFSKEHRERISQSLKGHQVSEKTKRKMSESHKGIEQSIESRIKKREAMLGFHHSLKAIEKIRKFHLGKILSDETKKKISITHKGLLSLNKHPNWKGGKSFEPYGTDFTDQLRYEVYKRFNYQCFICKLKMRKGNGKFQCHHIDYNKENNVLRNLVLLCSKCHPMTNFNREHWIEFFRGKIHD